MVILGVFSLACGLAQTIEQLIVFRALQGLGGSGLYAMPLTTLPEVTPPEKFPIMSAAMGIVFAVSAVLYDLPYLTLPNVYESNLHLGDQQSEVSSPLTPPGDGSFCLMFLVVLSSLSSSYLRGHRHNPQERLPGSSLTILEVYCTLQHQF